MCEHSTRIRIKSQEQNPVELEVEATLFRGRVCLAFKTDRTASNAKLMDELLKLHQEGDPSIRDVGATGVKLMNTRFSDMKTLMEFLGKIGYKCQQADAPSGGAQKIRFLGDK